jgi:hypothetical protein
MEFKGLKLVTEVSKRLSPAKKQSAVGNLERPPPLSLPLANEYWRQAKAKTSPKPLRHTRACSWCLLWTTVPQNLDFEIYADSVIARFWCLGSGS